LWRTSLPTLSWSAPDVIRAQLDQSVCAFLEAVVAGGHATWKVFWAAGAGIVGSTADSLAAETRSLRHVLECLTLHSRRLARVPPGFVFLASSAGGVYGGCPDSPATEDSVCHPISDYGREKLRQEAELESWARANAVSHLVGRISNLYGPGQNLDKPQGLVSHLLRSLVLNDPVQLFVPLDTLRDYVYAADCADAIVRGMSRLVEEAERGERAQGFTKIFASEQPTSISALIGIITRVTRRRPHVISVSRPTSFLQPRRLSFRSSVWRDLPAGAATAVPVGVSQVYQHMLQLFRDGRLAPPRPAPEVTATPLVASEPRPRPPAQASASR
jgi:UDP-glucose 4-epimerase